MSARQYADLFGPVIVPAAQAYDPSGKSWTYAYPDKIDRKKPASISFIVAPVYIPSETDRIAGGASPSAGTIQFVQYQSLFGPTMVEFPQGTAETGWTPQYPDRIHRKPRQTAATNWWIFVPPVVVVPGGSSISVGSVRFVQYQELFGPTSVPVPFAGDTNPRGVLQPDRVYPKTRLRAAQQQAFAFDRFEAPDVVDVPDHSWKSSYPDPVRVRRRSSTGPFTAERDITSPLLPPVKLDCIPAYPSRFPAKYPRAVYTWAQPHFGVSVLVPVMSWTGHFTDFPVRRKRIPEMPVLFQAPRAIPPPDVSEIFPHQIPSQMFRKLSLHASRQQSVFMRSQLLSYSGADGCGVF